MQKKHRTRGMCKVFFHMVECVLVNFWRRAISNSFFVLLKEFPSQIQPCFNVGTSEVHQLAWSLTQCKQIQHHVNNTDEHHTVFTDTCIILMLKGTNKLLVGVPIATFIHTFQLPPYRSQTLHLWHNIQTFREH